MLRDSTKGRSFDLATVTVHQVDEWIEARLCTLESRHDDHGFIEVDSIEYQQLKVFRALLEKMALATYFNSPTILDSLERRRMRSIQLCSTDSLGPV